jgi:hypothetical protein
MVIVDVPFTSRRLPDIFRCKLRLLARKPSVKRLDATFSSLVGPVYSCVNHVICQFFSFAFSSRRKGLTASTSPPVHPNRTDGCSKLHGARHEATLESLPPAEVEKNRRTGNNLIKSFSSLETNDCRNGEYDKLNNPPRMRVLSTMSFSGSTTDVSRVWPSTDVVPKTCGFCGYAESTFRM